MRATAEVSLQIFCRLWRRRIQVPLQQDQASLHRPRRRLQRRQRLHGGRQFRRIAM